MTETTEKLGKILFVPRRSGIIVQTPSFLVGEAGEIIYDAYQEAKAERFSRNEHFRLEKSGSEIVGANFPDANLINQVVRPFGVRASLPKDWDEEFMKITDGKHYTTANALVFRSLKDSYNRDNEKITKFLVESGKINIERTEREPALITGFDIQPSEEKEYKFIAVPAEGFNVHYDDRFLEQYNTWRFDETDEIGMPVKLDKQKGKRALYTRDDGISGFGLSWSRVLDSDGYVLSYSNGDGRVVLVSAEGASLK